MILRDSFRTILDTKAKPKALRAALCDWFGYGAAVGLACVAFDDDGPYKTPEIGVAFGLPCGVLSVVFLFWLRKAKR